ncbi:unnamed protein product [Cyberlindnera jadinii]|uniref:Gpi1-domain-containing protein n=1 Tax=Cyberlindnera jadinii (strain ATCC 18201 / CBS 1600 / BCRC 20928 / JCM 3617 / NBRC 0987 / NRRL Y-1542) TaxID=983966 RepID=A0A0H5BZP6_CYBJN|nr:unnamed protein product [Cyberlindnera jadinii]
MFQVYWPVDLLKSLERAGALNGLVLGLQVNHSSVVVVNVITYNKVVELVDTRVLRLEANGSVSLNCRETDVSIVGYFGDAPAKNGSQHWKEFFLDDKGLIACRDSMIVSFEPPLPRSMQLYTASPIELYLSQSLNEKTSPYVDMVRTHGHRRAFTPQDLHFSQSVETLNMCWIERTLLLTQIPQMQQTWLDDSICRQLRQKISQIPYMIFRIMAKMLKPLSITYLYTLIVARHISLWLIYIMNMKMPSNLPRLIDISATAQQIDLRLQQFSYLPIQYLHTSRQMESHKTKLLPKDQFAEYIRLYNTLWLVINDVTLGYVVSSFLNENKNQIVNVFDKYVVSKVLYSDLNSILMWLMDAPGGIKLNNELSAFLSDFFRWIIEFWKMALIDRLRPNYSTVIRIISVSSLFGATFGIAVFSDMLSILTFHIYYFYLASAKIYHGQLSAIRSLFRLFCGQKKNVLRHRVDSNDYTLDQQLLGTLIFTVLSFLLPTVLIFYLTFTITAVVILLITGLLEMTMSLLNHFPLFILLSRVKDYKRVPGGVACSSLNGYIHLRIKPIALTDMFAPFRNVLQKLQESYLSAPVITGLLVGRPVYVQRNKFYKLLYSTLPSDHMPTKVLLQEIRNSRSPEKATKQEWSF